MMPPIRTSASRATSSTDERDPAQSGRLGTRVRLRKRVGVHMESALGWMHAWSARVSPVAIPTLYFVCAVSIGFLVVTSVSPAIADSTADWLATSAARDGLNPYADLRMLSAHYSVDYFHPAQSHIGDSPWLHPRTPGALLVLFPISFVSPDSLFKIVTFLSLAILGYAAFHLVPRIAGMKWTKALLLGTVLIFSGPVVRTLQFGSIGLIIALLVCWFWIGIRDKDSWWAGIPLGVAIVLKLYPAFLLLPALLLNRRRAATSAVLVATSLVGAGMILFGIGGEQALAGLMNAGDVWLRLPSNGSVVPILEPWLTLDATIIAVSISVLLGALLWKSKGIRQSPDLAFAAAVVVMLVAAPLSWEAGDTVAFLPAFVGLAMSGGKSRWFFRAWLVLVTFGYYFSQSWESIDPDWAGRRSLVGRILLLAGLAVVAFTSNRKIELQRKLRLDDDGDHVDSVPASGSIVVVPVGATQ